MAKYKYGQNELDLQNLITNLRNNVDSYVQSKTDWSQAQKESFKEGYRDYIAGLQDQLANNTDRFSADEFGTITDKEGKLKDNTDTDYIYNINFNLLNTNKSKDEKKELFRNNSVNIIWVDSPISSFESKTCEYCKSGFNIEVAKLLKCWKIIDYKEDY